MDNTPLGEMNLEQIPKDILTRAGGHKSHWAIFLILSIAIIFGIFWFVEAPSHNQQLPIVPVVQNHQSSTVPKTTTSDLEASVGAINIPDYSEEL